MIDTIVNQVLLKLVPDGYETPNFIGVLDSNLIAALLLNRPDGIIDRVN